MTTDGRCSFNGSTPGEDSEINGDDDAWEATRLVPSSSPISKVLRRFPSFLHRSSRHGAAVGQHVHHFPEYSDPHRVKRNCFFETLVEVVATFRAILGYSWLNSLLVFVPLAIASYLAHANHILVFTANVIAVVPLSSLLTCATENIARESGDVVGALLNVTFGNLVEIVIFAALYHNQYEVVQASLLGSILVNLLLILGVAILAGSFCHQEQSHSKEDAQALACLLSVSVFSLLIPSALVHSFDDLKSAGAAVLTLSRASSLTLLAIYLLYIFLQIKKSTANRPSIRVVSTDGSNGPVRTSGDISASSGLLFPRSIRFQDEESAPSYTAKATRKDSLEMSALDDSGQSQLDPDEASGHLNCEGSDEDEGVETQEQAWKTSSDKRRNPRNSIYQFPSRRRGSDSGNSSQRHMSPAGLQPGRSHRSSYAGSTSSLPRLLLGSSVANADSPSDIGRLENSPMAIGKLASSLLLVISSLLVAICADFLVNTLDDIVESGPFSEAFIGLIILPVAGNCAELITATAVASKGKFDLAIGVSVGSSVQISLFVTPLVVIAGWALNRDMTMYFGIFETVALFATTFLVNVLILYGKSNFLEGSLLCACYFIIAVGAYLFPTPDHRAPHDRPPD
ncbi:calcium/proton exchanger [Cladophialophora bantiana CBS 173.52]|uniref:Calcium/proton exchanger n=1 Tax=Cladophialophora bantiana (strain ATCC 10958 / CBS 173.52 / CDC B-1940 / NIH 8579) TaxID=1442370 RepID=A0A0D2F081_CLAB1|nr:calcium/proton exchanger [Cladophialophora bantiana CBS 173.52]KIW95586.1 calcium/proton exchanger [Cladophialophora bantiana CBS 173.52]